MKLNLSCGAPGRWRLLRAALLCLVAFSATGPAQAGREMSLGVPGVTGGVVTTSQPEAARAGAEILRAGGNAIDAAAAVAFALNVVEPQSSGIGGGGFMVIYLADGKRTITVDSRETAAAAATPDMFVPFTEPGGGGFGAASTSGIAVGVPGMVRGIALALEQWGSMEFPEVLAPAIRLAKDGFRVGPRLVESVQSSRLANEPGNPAYDRAREVFLPGGTPLAFGELLVQPELARTLRLLAEQGPGAFYTGALAEAIVATQKAARSTAPAGAGEGRMTLADLAGYQAKVRAPIEADYRGLTLKGMGPPSSGPLTVLHALRLMERFPLGDESRGFGFGTTRTLNVMVEALRLAFADRAVWMGDAEFVDVPVDGLLSDGYIEARSARIDPDGRQEAVQPDDPRPFDSAAAGTPKVELAVLDSGGDRGLNTTHFSIVDADGNIVSYTNTVESAWGTGLMVPGFGFLLNNELTDFNFVPAANPDPAAFNPGANDVAPGKRPRSSMSPVILFDGHRPLAAYGSPGGSTIISSVLNATLNLVDHSMDVQEAVDAPRIAQTSANGATRREIGFDDASLARLEALGHTLRAPSEIGSVQAVVVDRSGGLQYGAADRRRVGGIVTLDRDALRAPREREGKDRRDKDEPKRGRPNGD